MEFGTAFPADGEAFEVVEQGEGLLDDVAEFAQALDVRAALLGDDGHDPALAQCVADRVGVVALVAEEGYGPSAGSSESARDGGGMPSTKELISRNVVKLVPAPRVGSVAGAEAVGPGGDDDLPGGCEKGSAVHGVRARRGFGAAARRGPRTSLVGHRPGAPHAHRAEPDPEGAERAVRGLHEEPPHTRHPRTAHVRGATSLAASPPSQAAPRRRAGLAGQRLRVHDQDRTNDRAEEPQPVVRAHHGGRGTASHSSARRAARMRHAPVRRWCASARRDGDPWTLANRCHHEHLHVRL